MKVLKRIFIAIVIIFIILVIAVSGILIFQKYKKVYSAKDFGIETIISKTDYDKICQEMIIEFDSQVEKFYNKRDALQGFVEIENRRGVLEQFPITTISIAVVEVDPEIFKSTLEIGEVGAQVKHRAKTIMGSTYVINRRKN